MNENTLEILSLITIIISLIMLYFFILDYNPEEFTNPNQNYDKTTIKGIITQNNYDINKNQTKFKIKTEITINGIISGQIKQNITNQNEIIKIIGSYQNGYFFAEKTINEKQYK
ncbi:hypothetical protein K9L67_05795 [Candidatus Woesearchaeota archaeon]|nr:hypothetical protein [Candidatus Woesearchaeota archaeon]MCF7901706.1 hypothetical protein [Candidatus Woesearchaeota archaeon]MCF8014016.1 hypothetical protein [Candidatus Woesearchaeota archaeon]